MRSVFSPTMPSIFQPRRCRQQNRIEQVDHGPPKRVGAGSSRLPAAAQKRGRLSLPRRRCRRARQPSDGSRQRATRRGSRRGIQCQTPPRLQQHARACARARTHTRTHAHAHAHARTHRPSGHPGLRKHPGLLIHWGPGPHGRGCFKRGKAAGGAPARWTGLVAASGAIRAGPGPSGRVSRRACRPGTG